MALLHFNEDHEIFRKSVRSFVEKEIKPFTEKWEEEGAVPEAIFRMLGELGFLGIRLSPEFGGSGLDFWYTAILVQELVRTGSVGVAVSILAHAEFASHVIDRVGSSEQKKEFLEPAIKGEKIGGLGLTEPEVGSDLANINTTAKLIGGFYIVNGAKTFITNGTIADFITTAVRTGEKGYKGISLLIIPTVTKGFIKGQRLKKIGAHASDTAEIFFEDCKIPRRNLLGAENGGFKLILEGFRAERLVLALICCAQMRLLWGEAKKYGRERKAFGKALNDFQIWRHRLADALTTIGASESLTYHAIDLYVRDKQCDKEISMAKLFSAEAIRNVAHECMQIHGGYGFIEEYLIARLTRDSIAFTVGAGTSEIMREIIAKEAGL